MTFAIITPALFLGAFAERASFGFVLLFLALWILLVYAPVTHWLWGAASLPMAASPASSARRR